jgi:hypothetical protein
MSFETPMITEPGVYEDLPARTYRAQQDWLSSSTLRPILDDDSCPAKFKWRMDHPASKDAFDLGAAVHALLRGTEAEELYPAPFRDWRTKAAQLERELARGNGLTPVLPRDLETARAMVQALGADEEASLLLSPRRPETSVFWVDETGVRRRCRFLRDSDPETGRTLLIDYKTAGNASPRAWARDAAVFGYEMQAAWCLDGATAAGIEDPVFVFLVQEKTPPYLPAIYRLDAEATRIGRWRNRRALDLWQRCTATGVWPGYRSDGGLPLPSWHVAKSREALG